MPFRSNTQRAFLEIHHPEVAKEFASETSEKQEKSLPARKGKKGKRLPKGRYGH